MKMKHVFFVLSVFCLTACSEGDFTVDDFQIEESVVLKEEINKDDSMVKNFMNETGVYLSAKEVQYDLANNLDTKFVLSGELSICNYYNYGYTNEKRYFCAKVIPDNGDYTDIWYVYFLRENTKDIYNLLLDGDLKVILLLNVESGVYQKNQGNMASVKAYQIK